MKEKLPNSTLILVFGILSIIGCCCYGVLGIIFGILAIVLANKAKALYYANPDLYMGYENVKTGRILGIIGLVLSILAIVSGIVTFFIGGGLDAFWEIQREIYGNEF
ncbi:CCC motif membrane protein [Zunongwangia endophytica]|uniref:CCC motif membrane protein n=1 Tax=Zunongwangia endophytica TaxID=1808945 RepID=A0ABV8H4A9_9FLAO|nr:CCC motif membrane protein [Zunongwangia endophytica]MDN3594613.1 CCC motif membrane protein [Zunongwangia endophytica]